MEPPSSFEIKVPDFESNIPQHLLENASKQDRYIMECLSVLTQKTDWQTDRLIEGSESFKRLEDQMRIANGRTGKNEKKIEEIIPKLEAIDNDLKPVRFVTKWGKNKYVWVFAVVLVLIGIPYIAGLGLTLKGFVALAIKYLFGN